MTFIMRFNNEPVAKRSMNERIRADIKRIVSFMIFKETKKKTKMFRES